MYVDYFGFKHRPFEMTPDPSFLLLTETHREALAHLQYGVDSDKGFVLLTGEVGTGKTTLLQVLIAGISKKAVWLYVTNPAMTPSEFRTYLSKKLHLNCSEDKGDFLIAMEHFLQVLSGQRKKFVLIVDEAQKCSSDLLEEIRLLSNIETPSKKLLTIFLVGQPELTDLLKRDESRGLRQRIGLKYEIRRLKDEETHNYIKHRVLVAGASTNGLFSSDVTKKIHELTKGYPRAINSLCDHALIAAYAEEKHHVTPQMVKECASDLGLDADSKLLTESHRMTHGKSGTARVIIVLAVLVALITLLVGLLYKLNIPLIRSVVDFFHVQWNSLISFIVS